MYFLVARTLHEYFTIEMKTLGMKTDAKTILSRCADSLQKNTYSRNIQYCIYLHIYTYVRFEDVRRGVAAKNKSCTNFLYNIVFDHEAIGSVYIVFNGFIARIITAVPPFVTASIK